jgi:hypothetical protein
MTESKVLLLIKLLKMKLFEKYFFAFVVNLSFLLNISTLHFRTKPSNFDKVHKAFYQVIIIYRFTMSNP